MKLHSEEFKTFSKNNSQNRQNVEKVDRQITEQEDNTTNPTRMANPTSTEKLRKPKVNPSLQNRHNNTKLQHKRHQNARPTPISNEQDDPVDLTITDKRCINQSTLLVGDSLLKDIKNSDLKHNTTVRSFPRATTGTLKSKISAYNIEKCKTVIVHVGSNDADNGKDLDDFYDDYSSLLDSLAHEDRRIIVSGLLPRKGANIKPYNEQLKSLCEENDIEFYNNFDSFLFASGELPKTYFKRDKIHLNYNGTKKLLSNTDRIIKVTKPGYYDQTAQPRRNSETSGYRPGPKSGGWAHNSNNRPAKYCHICMRNGHATQECWFNGRNEGWSMRQPR